MSTTLPLFWQLSSASTVERIGASVKLIRTLEQFQSQFVVPDSSFPPESCNQELHEKPAFDGLDTFNAQDISYSIRRLVRGMASPRESSRLGFAVALTELLSRIDTVTCTQMVSFVLDSSQTQGSMTGQEVRDALFARLFGLMAIILSGLLVRNAPLTASASPGPVTLSSSLSGYLDTLTQLLALGDKKSWLRESAWWAAMRAADALEASNVPWKNKAIESTLDAVFVANKSWSPEKIAFASKLQSLYPERDWRMLLSPSFEHSVLLSTANLNVLARILKGSNADEDDDKGIPKVAAGNWKSQVHFVWDVLLEQLLPGPNSTASERALFQEFFLVVVDESLFSSTSSPQRKYSGFQLFQKSFQCVMATDLEMLFTKNFMRTWINHLSQKDRYLHKIAKQVALDLQARILKNPSLGFTLLLQLTGTNGSRLFDKLTKTKTVESILTSMDTDGIKNYVDYLLMQVNQVEAVKTDIQAINSKRTWIIDQFTALIRNGAVPKNDDWIQSILDWFLINGLFLIKKSSAKSPHRSLQLVPNPPFSQNLRHACRTRLLSCLADLTGTTFVVLSGDKMVKKAGVASNGDFWISRVLGVIEQLVKDTKHVTMLSDVDGINRMIHLEARKLSKALRKVSGGMQEAARGTELLLMASLLQQYCAEDAEELVSESLKTCIDAATCMVATEDKKLTNPTMESEPVTEPIDVVVDIIIGFLEKSTAYRRTVANEAFSLLSSSVQDTTIDLILAQLERRNPAELVDNENVEIFSSNEDSEDADDREEVCYGDSDDVSISSKDLNSDERPDDDPELRRKIEEAFRVRPERDADSGENSEEEPMDDDQMLAVDEQLAQIFRSRVNGKNIKDDVDIQREATHFKNRVLELLDILAKKQPSSTHIIRVILPLVDLITTASSDERQLSDKAKGILTNRIAKSKELPSSMDVAQITEVLNALHCRVRKLQSTEILPTLSQCSLYISKLLLQQQEEEPVLQVYRKSLMDFTTRKGSALNGAFFKDFFRRFPIPAWALRDHLVEVSGNTVNVYRQCQVFQLLQILISQLPSIGYRQDEFLTFMPKLRDTLLNAMTSACENSATLTTSQMKDLLKISLLAIRQIRRSRSTQINCTTIWQPKLWEILRNKLAGTEPFKGSMALQSICQQIIQTSQDTNSLAALSCSQGETKMVAPSEKRKTVEDGTRDESEGLKKAKRKKVQCT